MMKFARHGKMDSHVIFASLSIAVNHFINQSVFFEWVVCAHWVSTAAAVGRCLTENVLTLHMTKRWQSNGLSIYEYSCFEIV